MFDILTLLVIGLAAGVLSGLMGIGGGIIIIPALIYFLGFDQHRAAGTTLALMIPPIGILAVMEYYRKGFVDVRAAALICAAFFLGGLIGARWAVSLPTVWLQRGFGAFLLFVAVKMIFWAK